MVSAVFSDKMESLGYEHMNTVEEEGKERQAYNRTEDTEANRSTQAMAQISAKTVLSTCA